MSEGNGHTRMFESSQAYPPMSKTPTLMVRLGLLRSSGVDDMVGGLEVFVRFVGSRFFVFFNDWRSQVAEFCDCQSLKLGWKGSLAAGSFYTQHCISANPQLLSKLLYTLRLGSDVGLPLCQCTGSINVTFCGLSKFRPLRRSPCSSRVAFLPISTSHLNSKESVCLHTASWLQSFEMKTQVRTNFP